MKPASRLRAAESGLVGRRAPAARGLFDQLLFPQVCFLAAVAGVLAFRYPGPGLTLLALLCLLDCGRAQAWAPGQSPEQRLAQGQEDGQAERPGPSFFVLRNVSGLARFAGQLAALVISFLLAFGYTALREPEEPPLPAWLQEAVYPSRGRGQALPVAALVESATGMPGGRVRILLADLRPAKEDAPDPRPYAGKIVWNWYGHDRESGPLPQPGQTIRGSMRFVPVRGFANPGTWNTETHWHDQGVWLRAWPAGKESPRFFTPGGAGAPAGEPPPELDAGGEAGLSLRGKLAWRFAKALPKDSAAAGILPALVFGDRSGISQEQADLFARGTLAHSLALSGLHLGFAALAGFMLASGLGRLFPSVYLRLPRPTLSLLLSVPLAAGYLWLGQAPVSLVRAACMLFFWALLLFLRRPRVLLDGLLAAVCVILVLNPFSLFDVSLQLSALSVGTIALCLPPVTWLADALLDKLIAAKHAGKDRLILKKRFLYRLGRGALITFGISFCIQVALLPVTLRVFNASGLLFPLNILWLPVLGSVVMPFAFAGLAAAGLGLETAASVFLRIACLPCEELLDLLQLLDQAGWLLSPLMPRPHWLFSAGFWLFCLVGPRCAASALQGLRRVRIAAVSPPGNAAAAHRPLGFRQGVLPLCCALALMLCPLLLARHEAGQTHVRVRLMDVGQGQSVLVEWSGLGAPGSAGSSGRVLVDGGGFPSGSFDTGKAVLAPALTDNALPRLLAVVNSHPDGDHLDGLLFILETFKVGAYYTNGGTPPPLLAERELAALRRAGLEKRTLEAGDVLSLGPGLRLEALWPSPPVREAFAARNPGNETGNNASLVLRLVWEGAPLALLCGDMERSGLRGLLRSGAPLAAEVLVLPHHGAASSAEPDLYAAVSPRVALAATGFRNRWGFPSSAVREALGRLGTPVYDTGEQGQIAVMWRRPDEPGRLSLARSSPDGTSGRLEDGP